MPNGPYSYRNLRLYEWTEDGYRELALPEI